MCNYSESVRLAGIEEGKLRGAIDKAINEIVKRFSMSEDKAKKLVKKYWK